MILFCPVITERPPKTIIQTNFSSCTYKQHYKIPITNPFIFLIQSRNETKYQLYAAQIIL